MKNIYILPLAILLLLVNPKKVNDDPAVIGVNLRGWMVLEPFITPSLFY